MKSCTFQHSRVPVFILVTSLLVLSGCSRRFWRVQAENDSYAVIADKLNDPHWDLPRIGLTPDPRSRFFDPYDPDCAPLPPDDPAAHQVMHCVSGRQGYKDWHCYGDTLSVENPDWLQEYLGMRVPNPSDNHADVQIPEVDLQDSVELTYIHSREYQTQLEDVYLRALDLTLQQFNFGTRFIVGGRSNAMGGGLFTSNRIFGGNDTQRGLYGLGFRQQLSSGTQLSLELLNSITWRNGADSSDPVTVGWRITQPLLRQAGRKVVLEQLTQVERSLLYEVRNMARFRQTLFTDVASDYLRLQQQAQLIINQQNNIRQLEEQIEIGLNEDSFRLGYVRVQLALLPEGMQLPEDLPEALQGKLRWSDGWLYWMNEEISDDEKEALLALSEDNLFRDAAQELIRFRELQATSLRVQTLITRLNAAQGNLVRQQNTLEALLDAFKIRLGLPPNVSMTVDNSFLSRFELIDTKLLTLVDRLKEFQEERGVDLIAGEDEAPDYPALKNYVTELAAFRDEVRELAVEGVRSDFAPVRDILDSTSDDNLENPDGRSFLTVEERQRVIKDVASDLKRFQINESDFERWSRGVEVLRSLVEAEDADQLLQKLDRNSDGLIDVSEFPDGWRELPRVGLLNEEAKLGASEVLLRIRDGALSIREKLVQTVQSLEVIQAGLRVEVIELNDFALEGREGIPEIEEVVAIGQQFRHDLMNQRAAVMDARRNVEVAANALKARLDLDVNGDLVSNGGPNDDLNVTLDFKTPIDQVTERNTYNRALIQYQRARRSYIAFEDQVKQAIRNSWRNLQRDAISLEIQRQSIRNAALQYDNTATGPQAGDPIALLNALDAVLAAQNQLLQNWISYETNRLNIFRDMGIMEVDPSGLWQDPFYQGAGSDGSGLFNGPDSLEAVPLDFNRPLGEAAGLPEDPPVINFSEPIANP